jgi:hypothetical protein
MITSGRLFVSHAYLDATVVERIVAALPPSVDAVLFPRVDAAPDQAVSDGLIDTILSCEALLYLTGGRSERSFWVAFERDYALRAGLRVFRAEPETDDVTEDAGTPLDLVIDSAYAPEDEARVKPILEYLKSERYFDIGGDRRLLQVSGLMQSRMKETLGRGGFIVVFWSNKSDSVGEIPAAIAACSSRPDQLLVARLDPTPLPAIYKLSASREVQLYGDDARSHVQRLDDLVVALYGLHFRKARILADPSLGAATPRIDRDSRVSRRLGGLLLLSLILGIWALFLDADRWVVLGVAAAASVVSILGIGWLNRRIRMGRALVADRFPE